MTERDKWFAAMTPQQKNIVIFQESLGWEITAMDITDRYVQMQRKMPRNRIASQIIEP